MAGETVKGWISSNIDIINNIAKTMEPIQKLITGAAYIMGIMFAIKALMTLKQFGESRSAMSGSSHSIKEPLIYFLVSAVLLYFPTALRIMNNTVFGPDYSPLSYLTTQNPGGDFLFGSGSLVGKSLALIIQTIGGIAFVRGWLLIARASGQGQQPGGTGKGLMHVFGGILAMNIVLTLQIINNTLYGT